MALLDDDIETSGGEASRPGRSGPLSRTMLIVFAVTCGISVANIYYAQPLLDSMAAEFSIAPATVGLVVTLTQAGYAAGLLLVVPLGDLADRRRLVVAQTFLFGLALLAVSTARNATTLFAAMVLVGLLAVVVQVVVAFTASLAAPEERGRAVGLVTGGVVGGILCARFVAGALADLGGWRSVYMASALLTFVMSALLARLLPQSSGPSTSETYGEILRSVPRLFLRDRLLRTRSALAFMIFASFSTLWTGLVFPLSSSPLFLSHTQIGLFGLAGLAGAVSAGGAGRWADRGLADRTTGIALALLTASWLPIALLHSSLVALAVGVLLLDMAVQAVHVTNQSLIFAAHPEARSRLVGGYMVFYSAGSGVGAISATTLYSWLGWPGVAAVGAAFGGAGLAVWWITRDTGRSG